MRAAKLIIEFEIPEDGISSVKLGHVFQDALYAATEIISSEGGKPTTFTFSLDRGCFVINDKLVESIGGPVYPN